MELKTLEIKGFKSFADKTTVNFNQNITGIVGPNGCGKSNIVDAIRWVLGEQKSKELRSDKMSSIIFNGTKARKQGGLAEVSLTFENTKNILPTEYHTVTITRLLYRSGESEYRLNNVPCRLKDIKSLFMDTGIGSNSYAIIALGMVDDLLNDRENSRRRLFEQAAGISKYKTRKRETFNKLKGTEADLDRVEDLLFEIENNLKSLEKQAKRAKKYFELKEDYKNLSIELAVFRVKDQSATYKELQEKITKANDDQLQATTQATKLEAQLEAVRAGSLDEEKALSDKQKHLNDLVGNIRSKENDKKVFSQKIQFIKQNEASLFNQIETAQGNLAQVEKDIIYYRGEINQEKDIEERLEAQLKEAQDALDGIKGNHGTLKSDLDEFMNAQQDLERQVFEIEKRIAINASQKENLEREIVHNNEEIERRQKEVGTLRARFDELSKAQNEKNAYVLQLEDDETNRKIKIEVIESEVETVRKELVTINRQLDAKRNEFQLTKSLVENLEGFPESIKFLNKSRDWDTKAPLLSDIIYCPEEYRVAIENYLENYMSYYVVKNESEAVKAISLLSKSQKGKANFFLLDKIAGYSAGDAPPPVAGAVSAMKVVETEAEYFNLCSYLLGNVWLTEGDAPPEKALPNDTIALSKSGKYVKTRFTLSGGSVGLFEGKRIGRKKNLDILKKDISSLETKGKQLTDKFESKNKELKELRQSSQEDLIKKEKNQLNQIQQETIGLQTRLENFESFLKDVQRKKAQSEERIQQMESQDAEITVQLTGLRADYGYTQQQIAKMDTSYRLAAETLSKASTDYNQKNIEFIRQQNKTSALSRELTFRENQLSGIKAKMATDRESKANAAQDLQETEQAIAQLETDLVELYQSKTKFEGELNEAEQKYYGARGNINELENQLRQARRVAQDSQMLVGTLKDKYNEVRLELSSIGERLRIEFNIEINDIIQREPNPEYQKADLEHKVSRLKSRLDNYGEINPMAVEAYDEMNERYEFITSQRNDLLNAKDSLLETIKEIETTATEHFMTAFTQVREHFKVVFRSLFTEDDTCDLLLEDEENPLESNIKITARPKGKRPQTINQLSGGEKTLTATALLFSLYLLKPAPFCIFDEVDAPLDDANIGKFNKIIKKFSEDSQFIIITHNKATMSAVDIIYGVTMAEQGVSRVVPVDFRSLN